MMRRLRASTRPSISSRMLPRCMRRARACCGYSDAMKKQIQPTHWRRSWRRKTLPKIPAPAQHPDLFASQGRNESGIVWSGAPRGDHTRTVSMNTAKPATSRIAPRLATPTDLGANATKDIAGALNALLADTFALYLKTKNFHWHISGPHFRDYHLLLDEQADQIFAMTDVLAERVRKLGGTTLRSIGDISRH